jgi:hypothetical protein
MGSILENASLENVAVRMLEIEDFLPFRSIFEESAHAKRRTPIKIAGRVITIPQESGNRNDALVFVVGKRYENMDNTRLGLGSSYT